eukprot:CAMPEP_0117027862 /NCGR_PEP_ID=MMETSP0472-20121206/20314_1 /TAXON_ID=693140 ORGANISM="Tiarina fusus, Strain LIS" /NCGR_SAMPLE_ID=MMETSP0472 /ASSEMBLY_ACC=CAM_ASM_000603 /LENGTH=218 /DNA_ID=CAMNT_0004735199 /DNA_START=50 /DNA_END=706 /DNA_ORIENTATION=+
MHLLKEGKKDKLKEGKKGQTAPTANKSIENGREYKLVVMGEGGVGKTAITIQFMNNKFVADYDPTIEDAYKKEYTIDDHGTEKNIVVEIIDTAGQEDFSPGLHDKFIRQGEGFILVYSITAASSFEKVKEVREKILFSKNAVSIPMIIVGNKKDLEKERKIPTETAEALAEQWGCQFLEASAKTGENVQESIDTLLFEVAKAGIVADDGVMRRPAKGR